MRRRRPPAPPRRYACLACGTEIVVTGHGGPRRLCDGCRRWEKVDRAVANLHPIERYACGSCGLAFNRPRTRGQRPKWCPSCRPTARMRANPEPKKAADQRRRARRAGARAERFTAAEIYERDGWRCGICSRAVSRRKRYPDPRSASLDHIVPLSKGGQHVRSNVQCAHLSCNLSKNAGVGGAGDQLRLVG